MVNTIEWKSTGNLLDTPAEALVNTVNTVGVMGKGVALQFKQRFPANYKAYRQACQRGEVQIGRMFITEVQELAWTDYIINFPTKEHFQHPSRLEYIEAGLRDLVHQIEERDIRSIALPPLGAGLGRLDWQQVKPLMRHYLEPLAQRGVWVTVFEPNEAFQVVNQRPTTNQKLTPWRVMLLEALREYIDVHYGASVIELHKIAYLLYRLDPQPDKDPQFVAWNYGPYSHRIHHALIDLKATWLTGFDDFDAHYLDPIGLRFEKLTEIEQAKQSLLTSDQRDRLDQLKNLITGFESPYGLELLATVDWVMNELRSAYNDFEQVCTAVYSWPRKPKRKRQLMPRQDVAVAHRQLLKFEHPLRYG